MYKVKIENFEGPLDLLLFFIKRDELNIYDIPITYITKEFLQYIHYIQKLDLEVAGEFIYMASYLLSIKSRMLLPKTETDSEIEEDDPRAELVRRLLEYRRFKEMSTDLEDLANNQSLRHSRRFFDADLKLVDQNNDQEIGVTLKDITLFDLMMVYKTAIANIPKRTFHEVTKISVSIDDQIDFVRNWVETKQRFAFTEMLQTIQEKIVIVVTFLAILELTKLQRITLLVNEDLSDFYVIRRDITEVDEDENTQSEEITVNE